jgi:Zn-dependent protease
MRWTFGLGRIAGLEIRIHLTFLILLAWVGMGAWSTGHSAVGVITEVSSVLLLFAGVVLHEMGHALVARRRGIGTRDITLLPIGGVARLDRIPERPRDEIVIAIAGPAVSFAIALALWALVAASGQALSLRVALGPDGSLLQRVAAQNLLLGLFNLLPAFPMDGGRVLRAGLVARAGPLQATRIAAGIGRVLATGLGLIGLMGNPFLMVIALFLWVGGGLELAETETRHLISGLPASAAMVTNFEVLRQDDPLERAVELTLAGSQRHYPVMEGERLVGILTQAGLLEGLAVRGGSSPVAGSMAAVPELIDPDEPLADVFRRIQGLPEGVAPVGTTAGIRGLIDKDNLLDLLRIRSAVARRAATAAGIPPRP